MYIVYKLIVTLTRSKHYFTLIIFLFLAKIYNLYMSQPLGLTAFCQYGKEYEFDAPVKLLDKHLHAMAQSVDEQVVVISQVI